jgi:hypothetical protein
MFDKDPLSALQALTAAQQLAFAPLAFQATCILRDRGVLRGLADAVPDGLTLDGVVERTALSRYAARVLLEAGLGLRLVWRQGDRFHLGKVGRCVLDDELTRVNFDFTRDVCYRAAAHLDRALQTGRPAGLAELGPWATLYEGLSILPEPARSSWFAFDHFYSDQAFPEVLDRLAADPPARVMDVGCNTGRFARSLLQRLPHCELALVDLPIQLDVARQTLRREGLDGRAGFHPTDLLDPDSALPEGYPQIVAVLQKARRALPPGGRVWILELFWDRQRFEAAAFSLQQTSLYFSCVANGNSQMYDSKVFLELVGRAGLVVTDLVDGVGTFHTLIECSAAA